MCGFYDVLMLVMKVMLWVIMLVLVSNCWWFSFDICLKWELV